MQASEGMTDFFHLTLLWLGTIKSLGLPEQEKRGRELGALGAPAFIVKMLAQVFPLISAVLIGKKIYI